MSAKFPNPERPAALPRFASEVEHYLAMHHGDPADLRDDEVAEHYWAGTTVEEAGRLVIERQERERNKQINPT